MIPLGLDPGGAHLGTPRIMGFMTATGPPRHSGVRATRRSSRSEPTVGMVPEAGLP